MAKPTPGSGKSQINQRGQTSNPKHGANPDAKVKGPMDATPYGITTRSDG